MKILGFVYFNQINYVYLATNTFFVITQALIRKPKTDIKTDFIFRLPLMIVCIH